HGGRVSIEGDVAGISLSIDGVNLGTPPARPLLVKPGAHRFEATRGSGASVSEEIDIGEGESTTFSVAAAEAHTPPAIVAAAPKADPEPEDEGRPIVQKGIGDAAFEAERTHDPLAARMMQEAHLEPRANESSSIFGRWWFWTIVGVAVS